MVHAQKAIQQDNRETVKTYNPATGELHKTYSLHTKDEAEQIIEDTHEAFLSWRKTPIEERAEIIKNIGKTLSKYKDELTNMMADQMGKPLEQGQQEVDLCAQICEYTATESIKYLQDEERDLEDGKGIITYQPIGVVLGLQPWNFPLYQAVRYSVANILAGNTTVFKHAEICWETAEKLERIFEEAGVPENVFSVIYVKDETVDELIEHDRVRAVSFTGSAEAGKIVAEKAGKVLKKTVLELGGSDPYIILEDADLDKAVEACTQGRLVNSGQTCTSAKRFIVLDSIYDDFKTKFVEAMKDAKYGNPHDDDIDFGPLARKDLQEKLRDQVRDSVKAGAKILCGGEMPEGEGAFYPATVLENAQPGSPAYDDELFGPVAVLFRAEDEAHAIQIANDHRYGLGGGVMSENLDRALKIAKEEIDTGMVNVNGYHTALPNMPFGGVKESGYGREHAGFGVREFVNIKSIMISK
ncbi:MAG: succinate-semialdehyde dehydrogenase [Micavibrio sp.]|nr:succinate-semialdehyde dehydrogenase [Micavibrio sp.]